MYKKISALKARQNLGQVMNEVAIRGDEYVIERDGKPLVAMIPMERYEILQKDLDDFFGSLDLMRRDIKEKNPEILDQVINEAVQFAKGKRVKSKKR
jgi:prevent-host-death family protein